MEPLNTTEGKTYRLIVARRNGTELLLVPAGTGFLLPFLEVGECRARDITTAMKIAWRRGVICLFAPDVAVDPASGNRIHYHVAEALPDPPPCDSRVEWFPLSSLSKTTFVDPADYVIVHQSMSQYRAYSRGAAPGPFATPGWFERLYRSVQQTTLPIGLHLSGEVYQLHATPSSSVIRLATDGPAVWFKAVSEPNQTEPVITLTLSRLFPRHIVRILTTWPEWNGWLALEAEGDNLARSHRAEHWKLAAAELAGLQVNSIDHQEQLLNSGAADLRTSALRLMLHPFLDCMATLMEAQDKTSLPVLHRDQVLSLAHPIENALSRCEESGIPNGLGHLDLNPSNIIVSAKACTFLDWAEAYVGNPFFTFEYFLQHLRRAAVANCELEDQLRTAYVQIWRRAFASHRIAQALTVAPMLAVFAYAVENDTWKIPDKTRNSSTAAYFCSLTRRLYREADKLAHWRVRC